MIIFIVLSVVKESHAMPTHYDLRDLGQVTSVKHCWTFAALGAIESNWLTQNLGETPEKYLTKKFCMYKGFHGD